ncbi:MAG: hypothetical protein PHD65_03595 [Gallionella sp.]|nr:hypothetical protein [Gallionella sp.]
MRNFSGATVAATPCCGSNPHASAGHIPVQYCRHDRSIFGETASSPKFNGYLKMKNLILAIMLIAIGAALPIEASAKIDPATLEKQRAENKARLERNEELRTGKAKKRFFDKKEAETYKARTLKLDAIPSSPRRRAR